MKLLAIIICIGIIWWVEYDRNSYLDSLPKCSCTVKKQVTENKK